MESNFNMLALEIYLLWCLVDSYYVLESDYVRESIKYLQGLTGSKIALGITLVAVVVVFPIQPLLTFAGFLRALWFKIR